MHPNDVKLRAKGFSDDLDFCSNFYPNMLGRLLMEIRDRIHHDNAMQRGAFR